MAPTSLLIGPVEGLTTGWHLAPERSAIPRGGSVAFRCTLPPGAEAKWTGVDSWETVGLDSVAVVSLERPGVRRASVVVQKDRELVGEQSCELRILEFDLEDIRIGPLRPEVQPFDLSRNPTNDETMSYYFPKKGKFKDASIAPFVQLGPARYRTSVERTVYATADVQPAALLPLMEWRVDGKPRALGSFAHAFEFTGEHRVEVGPPGSDQAFEVETYSVRVLGMEAGRPLPIGEPIEFEAVTEPPGFEAEIVWLASTKFGTAQPATGTGPVFNTTFKDVFGVAPVEGSPAWFGVLAGNGGGGNDPLCCECVVPPGSAAATFSFPELVRSGFGGHPSVGSFVEAGFQPTEVGDGLPVPEGEPIDSASGLLELAGWSPDLALDYEVETWIRDSPLDRVVDDSPPVVKVYRDASGIRRSELFHRSATCEFSFVKSLGHLGLNWRSTSFPEGMEFKYGSDGFMTVQWYKYHDKPGAASLKLHDDLELEAMSPQRWLNVPRHLGLGNEVGPLPKLLEVDVLVDGELCDRFVCHDARNGTRVDLLVPRAYGGQVLRAEWMSEGRVTFRIENGGFRQVDARHWLPTWSSVEYPGRAVLESRVESLQIDVDLDPLFVLPAVGEGVVIDDQVAGHWYRYSAHAAHLANAVFGTVVGPNQYGGELLFPHAGGTCNGGK